MIDEEVLCDGFALEEAAEGAFGTRAGDAKGGAVDGRDVLFVPCIGVKRRVVCCRLCENIADEWSMRKCGRRSRDMGVVRDERR